MPDYGRQRSTGETLQAVQKLLLLRPPTERDNPTILTINPSAWDEEHRFINIGPLLGVRHTLAGQHGDAGDSAAIAFRMAGWPLQRIARDFRPDLKKSTRIDIALLGETGECLVAVEVKRSSGPEWLRRTREGWAQLEDIAPMVPWHVVTDGTTFHLRNSTTGEHKDLDRAFGPEALATGDFSTTDKHDEGDPTSFSDLRVLLGKTKSVVIDHTIPLGRLEPSSMLRKTFEQEVGEPLPPIADLTQALLAWIAPIEQLQSVSAFAMLSLLRGESSQWIRDRLGSHFFVRSVVEFGNVFREVHPAVRFCTIQLSKVQGSAYLASVGGGSNQQLSSCIKGMKQFFDGERPALGFSAEVDPRGRWAPSLYDPELTKLEDGLAGIGPTKQLAEVCTIIRGINITRAGKSDNEGIPLAVRIAHIERPASLPEDVHRVALTQDIQRYVLRPGDVVMSSIGGANQPCVLVQSDLQVAASDRLLILRVDDNGITPDFLTEYLNSGLARRLLEERYAGSTVLAPRALGSLPVPILGRSIALDLREIGALEATLRQRADELQLQRQTLFDATNRHAFALGVQDLRRKGEVLSQSLLRANELGFQVANFYPFPIAYGYRLLASISNPTELYKEQLRVGENILAFLASVAMSLIQDEDRTDVGLDVRKIWDGGASPGDWRDITGKCCKVLSKYEDHPLAASIVGLRITAEKRGFGADVQRIIKAKNDFKHDREPRSEDELEVASGDLQHALDECVRALAFFTEYPIRQVVDVDVTRTGEVKLRCLAFVGDHPGLPQEEIGYRTPLPKRDLYIDAAGVGWIPLFPLIVARTCRSCKSRETFFVDKWNRQTGMARCKSFERGHQEESGEVVKDMSNWLDAVPREER